MRIKQSDFRMKKPVFAHAERGSHCVIYGRL